MAEERWRILFVTSEMAPLAHTGGLGDVTSALAKTLAALGHDVRVVMPLYQRVRDGDVVLTQVLPAVRVPLGTRVQNARLWQTALPGPPAPPAASSGVPVYFIEQDAYFARPGLYGGETGDYPDNAERFTFFCRAVLTVIAELDWVPDIMHCHDWQTALLPAYIRLLPGLYSRSSPMSVIYTIHNLTYQGIFPAQTLYTTGLPASLFQPDGIEFYGNLSFMKAGLLFADYLTTVSPTYAEEICTPAFGAGLDGLLRTRRAVLSGILNGVDYDVWNPATDTAIAAPYSVSELSGKAICKTALLRTYGLPHEPDLPLIGMIARLVDQKGVDLLAQALGVLLERDLRLVILGAGEPHYQDFLVAQARAHSDRMGVRVEFNDKLAHQIEAGSDCFLMPSRYEPCGLNQIYSMRYGTIPIVRATGGLRDTVLPYRADSGTGTGFVFEDASAEALIGAVQEALIAFADRAAWHRLMRNAMVQDFSWTQSAQHYVDLYRRAVTAR